MPESNEALNLPAVRFDHPLIWLIDIEAGATAPLGTAGYTVATGSLGKPYRVPKGPGLLPVLPNASVPMNFTEQEVIIVDLMPKEPGDAPDVELPPGQPSWWAEHETGVIDPRPSAMLIYQSRFDRIHAHGGVIIIFADAREQPRYHWGHIGRSFRGPQEFISDGSAYCDNWSLLSILDPYSLDVRFDVGENMRAADPIGVRAVDILCRIVADHLRGSEFRCMLRPTEHLAPRWYTLVYNKYGAPVAGLILPSRQGEGWVLILPRIVDRASLLARLLADALPELTPQLFPHVEGPRWVERPEYELPGVLEIKGQILQIQEDARAQVVALEQQIEEKRRELAYLHALLTEQDRPLVLAVRQALLTIGFESVVDVDEEKQFTESAGTSEPRFLDEDLRIEDGTPLVLIEIKGVTGTSTDDDVLQVAKHIGPRQKRLDRTDIRGLAIINHQRHLPPHQRAADPFRDAVLESAAFQDVGVWTTWDLHRLTRSFVKLGWRHAHVVPLFTERCGRVHPIPVHYQLVGTVAKFWDRVGVVSVELNAGELRLGNRIAFELPLEFEEQEVDSLQVDQEPVERAAKGSRAGVKTALTKDQLRPGVLVYLVDVDGQARSRLDG